MDALSFLKFWSRTSTMTTTSSTVPPHLVVETDTESDEEDSFFDLELTTVHDFDNTVKKSTTPDDKTMRETKELGSDQQGFNKMASKTELTRGEPISKRKVLPIEPSSKPQSPIALLKSAPSFRIFTFRKRRGMAPQRTEETGETQKQKQKKKEAKVFALKLNNEEPHYYQALGRDNSTNKHRNEESKPERSSKDVLQKYLKLMKPLYVKVSKRYSEKMKLSEEVTSASSPMASLSVASVSLRKEKPKNLGKSRSASSANRRDDTLLQQHDGIQSAILHCKKSLNSRGSSIIMSTEGSTVHSVRNSFEAENGANM